ncbi:MAG: T9SS type A sorting domain-containing protein [Bacteroidetes bacterium]|nr:T9SS type A sorting domain-containing protein [Bacteroidota bacterium]
MKKLILISFMLFTVFAHAQSNYQRKLFHTTSGVTSASVIYSNEYNTSTFVVRVIYPGTPFAAYSDVTKFTTTTGNVTSSKTFSVAGYDLKVLDVVKNNQMLYMTASLTNSTGTQPCIIKYNLSTNVTVWRKTLSINNEVLRSIAYDNAKNIFLLGNRFNASQSKTDLMVAKLDTNGVLFWVKGIGENTLNQNQNAGAIVFNGNRELYVTCAEPNNVTQSSVLRLDSAGTILTSKTITGSTNKFFQSFATILKGKLVTVDRSITSSPSPAEGPILMRMLDTNLTTITSKTLAAGIIIQDIYSNNTDLLVSGVPAPTGYGFKVIRFDTTFVIKGSRHFSKIQAPTSSFSNLTSSFIHSSNSSFHFFNPYMSDTVYLARTDIFEGVGCKDSVYNVSNAVINYTATPFSYTTSVITVTATTVTIPVASATYTSSSNCTALTTGIISASNNAFISLYPNPTNSVLNINSDAELISGMIIRDVTGKEILSGKTNTQINVSSLEAGVYFISLFDENEKLVCIKKFIKQ